MTNLGFGLLETHGTETQACTGLIESDSLLNITDTDMITVFGWFLASRDRHFPQFSAWFPSADQHVPIVTSPPPVWPKRCPWLEVVVITLHLEVVVFPRFDKSFRGHEQIADSKVNPGVPHTMVQPNHGSKKKLGRQSWQLEWLLNMYACSADVAAFSMT